MDVAAADVGREQQLWQMGRGISCIPDLGGWCCERWHGRQVSHMPASECSLTCVAEPLYRGTRQGSIYPLGTWKEAYSDGSGLRDQKIGEKRDLYLILFRWCRIVDGKASPAPPPSLRGRPSDAQLASDELLQLLSQWVSSARNHSDENKHWPRPCQGGQGSFQRQTQTNKGVGPSFALFLVLIRIRTGDKGAKEGRDQLASSGSVMAWGNEENPGQSWASSRCPLPFQFLVSESEAVSAGGGFGCLAWAQLHRPQYAITTVERWCALFPKEGLNRDLVEHNTFRRNSNILR